VAPSLGADGVAEFRRYAEPSALAARLQARLSFDGSGAARQRPPLRSQGTRRHGRRP
jgi:hypothetical protein